MPVKLSPLFEISWIATQIQCDSCAASPDCLIIPDLHPSLPRGARIPIFHDLEADWLKKFPDLDDFLARRVFRAGLAGETRGSFSGVSLISPSEGAASPFGIFYRLSRYSITTLRWRSRGFTWGRTWSRRAWACSGVICLEWTSQQRTTVALRARPALQ